MTVQPNQQFRLNLQFQVGNSPFLFFEPSCRSFFPPSLHPLSEASRARRVSGRAGGAVVVFPSEIPVLQRSYCKTTTALQFSSLISSSQSLGIRSGSVAKPYQEACHPLLRSVMKKLIEAPHLFLPCLKLVLFFYFRVFRVPFDYTQGLERGKRVETVSRLILSVFFSGLSTFSQPFPNLFF